MAILKKIWINSIYIGDHERHDLRIDWDNDRHQLIALKSLTPEDVKKGLFDAAHAIQKEQQNKYL